MAPNYSINDRIILETYRQKIGKLTSTQYREIIRNLEPDILKNIIMKLEKNELEMLKQIKLSINNTNLTARRRLLLSSRKVDKTFQGEINKLQLQVRENALEEIKEKNETAKFDIAYKNLYQSLIAGQSYLEKARKILFNIEIEYVLENNSEISAISNVTQRELVSVPFEKIVPTTTLMLSSGTLTEFKLQINNTQEINNLFIEQRKLKSQAFKNFEEEIREILKEMLQGNNFIDFILKRQVIKSREEIKKERRRLFSQKMSKEQVDARVPLPLKKITGYMLEKSFYYYAHSLGEYVKRDPRISGFLSGDVSAEVVKKIGLAETKLNKVLTKIEYQLKSLESVYGAEIQTLGTIKKNLKAIYYGLTGENSKSRNKLINIIDILSNNERQEIIDFTMDAARDQAIKNLKEELKQVTLKSKKKT